MNQFSINDVAQCAQSNIIFEAIKVNQPTSHHVPPAVQQQSGTASRSSKDCVIQNLSSYFKRPLTPGYQELHQSSDGLNKTSLNVFMTSNDADLTKKPSNKILIRTKGTQTDYRDSDTQAQDLIEDDQWKICIQSEYNQAKQKLENELFSFDYKKNFNHQMNIILEMQKKYISIKEKGLDVENKMTLEANLDRYINYKKFENEKMSNRIQYKIKEENQMKQTKLQKINDRKERDIRKMLAKCKPNLKLDFEYNRINIPNRESNNLKLCTYSDKRTKLEKCVEGENANEGLFGRNCSCEWNTAKSKTRIVKIYEELQNNLNK